MGLGRDLDELGRPSRGASAGKLRNRACDVFNGKGKPRPAGIRSMQEIVDSYWAQVEKVCATHPGCFTDQGAEQAEFVPTDRDVTADLNHLSIAGHRKLAAIAWQAFPEEIKQRR